MAPASLARTWRVRSSARIAASFCLNVAKARAVALIEINVERLQPQVRWQTATRGVWRGEPKTERSLMVLLKNQEILIRQELMLGGQPIAGGRHFRLDLVD